MAARKKKARKKTARKKASRKKTVRKTSARKKSKKKRSPAQIAATKKLVAMNKARRGKGRVKAKTVKKVLGDVCFRTHEGKMYTVGKVTATCPPGFFHSRKG